jgi:hypothetical protein
MSDRGNKPAQTKSYDLMEVVVEMGRLQDCKVRKTFDCIGAASTLCTGEVKLRRPARSKTPKSSAGNLMFAQKTQIEASTPWGA